jgi:photosystem II stability/assembly factor-like uncharacterized protein
LQKSTGFSGGPNDTRHRVGLGLLAWRWVVAALIVWLVATAYAWLQEPLPVPADRSPQKWSFWKPLETNAHRRLESMSPFDLIGVTFAADGQRGWVLDSNGYVFHTVDGGASWRLQTSDLRLRFKSIHMNSDGLRGWAFTSELDLESDAGNVFKTSNGGKSWDKVKQARAAINNDLVSSIYFTPDGQKGWVAGVFGGVAATEDGGQSWFQQRDKDQQFVGKVPYVIAFDIEGKKGWVASRDGTVRVTSDGGKSWRQQIVPKIYFLLASAYISDAKKGWITGAKGTIFVTTDAGENWSPQTNNSDADLRAINFSADGRRGLAVGDMGTMLATEDGGNVWKKLPRVTTQRLNAIHFTPDEQHGWVVGDFGVILATTDGGKTWHAQTSQSVAFPIDATFDVNGQRGWASNTNDTLLVTTNAGTTWDLQPSNSSGWLHFINFHEDGQRGWALKNGSTILTTANGGKVWNKQEIKDLSTPYVLRALYINPDGFHGWVVGDSGTVFTTTDGGKQWAIQTSSTQKSLINIHFSPDALHGWVVGADGAMVTTTNGGVTWQESPTNISEALAAVRFHADNLRGWAVSGNGSIIASTDGGKTWSPQVSHTTEPLFAVGIYPDGQRVWAMSTTGTQLVTDDAGKTWVTQPSSGLPVPEVLASVHFSPDGQRGWCSSYSGNTFATTDGGKHWQPSEPYSRSPAPWYWLAVLVVAPSLAWQGWRLRPAGPSESSVADMAASDAEVRLPADDKLAFNGLARGISRFLRNTQTKPPLTLAIQGDWGSGKSSLMQLVCADLRRFGHRPIWFNAWHHQKQEHLFAALLGAVHAQAVPSWGSFNGMLFRSKLLWLRSKQHFGVAMGVVVVVTAVAAASASVLMDSGSLSSLMLFWNALRQQVTVQVATVTAAVAGATALWALLKGVKVFGTNPALLLVGVREHLRLKAAVAQNDFRAQFARDFGELVKALPQRLVIVVDDLDRCHPAAVLDVMEAVNYLTSAGECFVMFGMASERVQAALGLAFKDIAAELVHMEAVQPPSADAKVEVKSDAELALAKRRAYAADYLQKLVNIEITVPSLEHQRTQQLLVASEATVQGQITHWWTGASKLWPLVFLMLAVVAGLGVAMSTANWWTVHKKDDAVAVAPEPAKAASVPGTSPSSPTPIPPVPPLPSPSSASVVVQVQPGVSADWMARAGWSSLGVVPLLLLMACGVWAFLRRTRFETRDSQQFIDALSIWMDVVASQRATPRAIKRFGNRLRYLAMLQQGEAHDETGANMVRAWLGGLGMKRRVTTPARSSTPLAEHQLIALGAWHEVFGASWKTALMASARPKGHPPWLSKELAQESALRSLLLDAVNRHQARFNASWPPGPAEIAIFERLMTGVRLAGDH